MSREQTTIRLPEELLEELKREAVERGMSFNEYMIEIAENRNKPYSSKNT